MRWLLLAVLLGGCDVDDPQWQEPKTEEECKKAGGCPRYPVDPVTRKSLGTMWCELPGPQPTNVNGTVQAPPQLTCE